MMPMLLDRRDRQHGDNLAHVGDGEIAPAHFGPMSGRQLAHVSLFPRLERTLQAADPHAAGGKNPPDWRRQSEA